MSDQKTIYPAEINDIHGDLILFCNEGIGDHYGERSVTINDQTYIVDNALNLWKIEIKLVKINKSIDKSTENSDKVQ